MNTNRLIAALLFVTVVLQLTILYRDYGSSSDAAPPAQAMTRPAPAGTVIDLSGMPTKGDQSAQIALVEFSDFECPYCARHATCVGLEIDKTFVSTGKLRYAYANNPLPIHENARLMATSAICAGNQDRYWEMYETLFRHQPKTRSDIITRAGDLGLDSARFQACVQHDQNSERQIERDILKAREFRFTGTPAFAVGSIDSKGRVNVIKFVIGAQPLQVFEDVIKEIMLSIPS